MTTLPASVIPLFSVTVLAVLPSVRVLKLETLLGTLTPADVPPNVRLEDEVVVSLVGVPPIAGPFNVSVFAATAKVPLGLRVNVPATVVSPPSVVTTAAEFAIVRFP